jgi:hypothetical protein
MSGSMWRGSGRLVTLWNIMKKFNTPPFLIIYQLMSHFDELGWREYGGSGTLDKISDNDKKLIGSMLTIFELECSELNLDAAVASIKKIRQLFDMENSTYGAFWPLCGELKERILDQCANRHLFSLSVSEAEYYSNYRPKWEDVIRRFPAADGDIEEAGKCFALGRYAAAVFHSLQIVEVGLIDLGKLIEVVDPLPGWTATTGALKKIVAKKYGDRTDFEKKILRR